MILSSETEHDRPCRRLLRDGVNPDSCALAIAHWEHTLATLVDRALCPKGSFSTGPSRQQIKPRARCPKSGSMQSNIRPLATAISSFLENRFCRGNNSLT
jgi:hypothetical protein